MPVEVQLVGSPRRWVLERSPISIGRSQDCEVELPADQFPGVSREHARLQWQGTELRLSDRQSGNGTYVNGQRIDEARLAVGDTVRLGPDGPELLIRIQAPVAATIATGASASVGEGRTMRVAAVAPGEYGSTMRVTADRGGATATSVIATPTIRENRAPVSAPAPAGAPTTASPSPRATTAAPAPPIERHVAERSMVEMKLGSLQRLIALSLVAAMLLLAGLLYVSQQLADTRADLDRMRSEAVGAAQHFAPILQADQQELQGADARIAQQEKAAEDHFVQRMNQELPAMIDRYMDQKMKEYGVPKPPAVEKTPGQPAASPEPSAATPVAPPPPAPTPQPEPAQKRGLFSKIGHFLGGGGND